MNSFFKTFLAALLAIVVANLLVLIFFVTLLAGFGSMMSPQTQTIEKGSFLRIDLSQSIVDAPRTDIIDDLDISSLKITKSLSLLQVLNAIERASTDERIRGIYLNIDPHLQIGTASLEEIRNELIRFKESRKPIISYADFYSQASYYLSSVSDQLYINPQGDVLWKGLASQVIFYKGLLDKLELKPEVFRHGEYKAAVEPFMLEKMSPENHAQTSRLIQTIWDRIVADVSQARGLDSARLQQYASELSLTSAHAADSLGMVDSLIYTNDVMALLCAMPGVHTDNGAPRLAELPHYILEPTKVSQSSKNKIAVLYAEGEIVDALGSKSTIVGSVLAEKLARIRQDDQVKGVVLRVNSPGGSAMASEVIWREMALLQQQKPLIVSMGNVAASGGYYISAPADAILASPTTITGSIGVFGLMFNAKEALRSKLGITIDVAKTNPSGDFGSALREVSPLERNFLQSRVEQVYTTFVTRVSEGRNMTTVAVDNIAGGRVWSGVSGVEIGLVDTFGGLKDAIALAAVRAGVGDDFDITTPTDKGDTFSMIIESISGQMRHKMMRDELGDLYAGYARLQHIFSQQGIQALMPYVITIE